MEPQFKTKRGGGGGVKGTTGLPRCVSRRLSALSVLLQPGLGFRDLGFRGFRVSGLGFRV